MKKGIEESLQGVLKELEEKTKHTSQEKIKSLEGEKAKLEKERNALKYKDPKEFKLWYSESQTGSTEVTFKGEDRIEFERLAFSLLLFSSRSQCENFR